jgi:nucleotide-binding universal stress UspA family protein
MNFQRILFPTDCSHNDDAALNYASQLAAECGAILYIAYVDDLGAMDPALGEASYALSSPTYEAVRDSVGRQMRQLQLNAIRPTVHGVTYDHRYLRGSTVEELLKFAKRQYVDLIVMCTHGRTGLARICLGSVAESVARRARCPVLLVKQIEANAESVLTATDVVGHV